MPITSKDEVFIRAPGGGDCRAFLSALRRSRVLHKPWITPKPASRREFAKYLNRFASGRSFGFLVIHASSGELAGMININDVIRGAFQSASLGYYAFLPYAGKGLMRQGMVQVLKYAFQDLKLHRLEANIQPANKTSIALIRKCGFVREGFSRRMLKICGKWRDHERWALLAEDFIASKHK